MNDKRYALIADIHGNSVALDAVLADIAKRHVDEIVCLGDIVGYGPRPKECLDRVRRECGYVIAGNHDRVAMSSDHDSLQENLFINHIAPKWYESFRWTHQALREDDREYLRSLPLQLHFERFIAAHAKPTAGDSHSSRVQRYNKYLSNTDGRVTDHMHEVRLYLEEQQLDAISKDLPQPYAAVFGHTHMPYILESNKFLVQSKRKKMFTYRNRDNAPILVNVPSVGLPRDADKRTGYAIIDARGVSLVRLSYDIEAALTVMSRTERYVVNDNIVRHIMTGA